MATHVSDLLLAMTVRAQQGVYDLADSAQSHTTQAHTAFGGITMQCDWVNQAKSLEGEAQSIIGNLWGLAATYGGYAAILLAIIIAILGKFAFGRKLTGLFLWIVVGLLAVGVVVQIVQSNIANPCN